MKSLYPIFGNNWGKSLLLSINSKDSNPSTIYEEIFKKQTVSPDNIESISNADHGFCWSKIFRRSCLRASSDIFWAFKWKLSSIIKELILR
jgi:hypothetical protein